MGGPELRLECLKLALENLTGPPATAVANAQAFYDFVSGKPARTPRQRIEDALEAAGVI